MLMLHRAGKNPINKNTKYLHIKMSDKTRLAYFSEIMNERIRLLLQNIHVNYKLRGIVKIF